MKLKFRDREINCGDHTRIIGILNVTPDSFSDGSVYNSPGKAVSHALEMLDAGADIVDIGGESSRPGAETVTADEELRRILPVVSGLKKLRSEALISIDTTKAEVAERALCEGADIINDISGLQVSPEIAGIVSKYKAGLILMHMRGSPKTMQSNLEYGNLIEEIISFLKNAAENAVACGVPRESIIIDPGIGFSKNTDQNLEIIANMAKLKEIGFPLLAGLSRKSFIGNILGGVPPIERLWGTAGAVAWLAFQGIDFVRVHDVREIYDLLKIIENIKAKIVK